ncbi:hypothetical protein TAMA11512_11380 [Selenomonas sp. TAMA-11512]|uniref:siroheme decarboxylase subunit beta n=1 Tax=Selenomonas sp. TAMA-11512 TaxID=3095337 RepID=UPI0030905F66|nr:hypothetical protein TAMA11512_11380 [Selenomonas sp. TAMA-11512]
MQLDAVDQSIIRAMQGDFPLVREPYKEIAEKVGIPLEELLERLQALKEGGGIRKMGAVLKHKNAGFVANVLCVWEVPANRMEEVAMEMSKDPAVSHCYDRTTMPDWPYSVYTMIHGKSREECERVAERLAEMTGVTSRKMLYSVKEWKKTSMTYFSE